MELDNWQKEVLATKGNICLVSGRQVGKSTVIAIKAGDFAANNPQKTIMIISAVERQALQLFEKVLAHIHQNYKGVIAKGKNKPTKHKLSLKNGSIIHCLPTGESGYGIRGYTIDQLYADEAAHINEDVWMAVTPMLATTGGDIILLSTPKGRDNYFFRSSNSDKFTQFRQSSEDSPHIDQAFIADEKLWMSKRQYSQEYLGQFVDDIGLFFSDAVIRGTPRVERAVSVGMSGVFYLGVDIARMGEDVSIFSVFKRLDNNRCLQVERIATEKTLTTDSTDEILKLNIKYNFKRIYLDSAGVGAGVFDQLLRDPITKRKMVSVENAMRPIENDPWKETPKQKKILKEELYDHLLKMMERKEITLLDNYEITQSLKSVQFEYTETGRFRIFGRNTHDVESIMRAIMFTRKKHLKPWISFI